MDVLGFSKRLLISCLARHAAGATAAETSDLRGLSLKTLLPILHSVFQGIRLLDSNGHLLAAAHPCGCSIRCAPDGDRKRVDGSASSFARGPGRYEYIGEHLHEHLSELRGSRLAKMKKSNYLFTPAKWPIRTAGTNAERAVGATAFTSLPPGVADAGAPPAAAFLIDSSRAGHCHLARVFAETELNMHYGYRDFKIPKCDIHGGSSNDHCRWETARQQNQTDDGAFFVAVAVAACCCIVLGDGIRHWRLAPPVSYLSSSSSLSYGQNRHDSFLFFWKVHEKADGRSPTDNIDAGGAAPLTKLQQQA
jgi:hypothetical protein